MIYKCINCHKNFSAHPCDVHKYCSRECRKQHKNVTVGCRWCGELFTKERCRKKVYCSKKCAGLGMSMDRSVRWNGGYTMDHGYKMIWHPHHPGCNQRGYVREHRLVMEKFLGRFLNKGEVIHHINGDKTDNRIENLMLFSNNKEHMAYHTSLKNL